MERLDSLCIPIDSTEPPGGDHPRRPPRPSCPRPRLEVTYPGDRRPDLLAHVTTLSLKSESRRPCCGNSLETITKGAEWGIRDGAPETRRRRQRRYSIENRIAIWYKLPSSPRISRKIRVPNFTRSPPCTFRCRQERVGQNCCASRSWSWLVWPDQYSSHLIHTASIFRPEAA